MWLSKENNYWQEGLGEPIWKISRTGTVRENEANRGLTEGKSDRMVTGQDLLWSRYWSERNSLGETNHFLGGSVVKNRLPVQEIRVWSLGQEDPLEKEMATHSSILACRIPWTEEPGGYNLWSHRRVRHDLQLNNDNTTYSRGSLMQRIKMVKTHVNKGCGTNMKLTDFISLKTELWE